MLRNSDIFPPNSDADIVFVSSDGVRYGLHSKNLEVGSGGFPPVASKHDATGISGIARLTVSDDVPLDEPSSVLDLLFAFIYPVKTPYIQENTFEQVHKLAEAAEKYQVYSAMHACNVCLRDFIKAHPIEIALFSAKHDYVELIEATAIDAMNVPLSTVIPLLPARLVIPWILYYEKWLNIYRSVPGLILATHHHPEISYGSSNSCSRWLSSALVATSSWEKFGNGGLNRFEELFPDLPDAPKCCKGARSRLLRTLREKVSEIQPFSDFLVKKY